MAKFCSDECSERGPICDFCKHYKDDYRDIKKIVDDKGMLRFAGEGICDIDNSETNADDGYNCENFECCMLDD